MFITLDELATRLNLPRCYLRDLVERGEIPYLNVGGRLRFDESLAVRALCDLAHRSGGESPANGTGGGVDDV